MGTHGMNPEVPRISIGWKTIQAVIAHRPTSTTADGNQRRVTTPGDAADPAYATLSIACDLGDAAAVDAAVEEVVSALGRLDVVVNNAGIGPSAPFLKTSAEVWSGVMRTNLDGTVNLCRAALPDMLTLGWGRIVNISSIVGATGNPGQVNYAASKAGMVGMTKSIAYEVASRGIIANCVAPGFISTAMTDKLNDEQKARILTQVPAGRMGEPVEIAAAVLYLSSAEAGYVTGATLHINGGMAMI